VCWLEWTQVVDEANQEARDLGLIGPEAIDGWR
jgi:hypothetical protein